MTATVVVGALMGREWFEPFDESLSRLGATSIWLGKSLQDLSHREWQELAGIVVELAPDIVSTLKRADVFSLLPVAGLPVCTQSEKLAADVGIPAVLWGETEARTWLATLTSPRIPEPPPVIAVWGSAGAPGATTFALNLAYRLARDRPTLLIDGDFLAPSMIELEGISPYTGGLLGALRVARNPLPLWDTVSACASRATSESGPSLLGGIRPGNLARLEAGAFSNLLDCASSEGIVSVVEVKCSLGLGEISPEVLALEAVLEKAQALVLVGWGTDLGVTRLVRDWELLPLDTDSVARSIVVTTCPGSSGHPFPELREALWRFTGCDTILRGVRDESGAETPLVEEWLRVTGSLSPRLSKPLA